MQCCYRFKCCLLSTTLISGCAGPRRRDGKRHTLATSIFYNRIRPTNGILPRCSARFTLHSTTCVIRIYVRYMCPLNNLRFFAAVYIAFLKYVVVEWLCVSPFVITSFLICVAAQPRLNRMSSIARKTFVAEQIRRLDELRKVQIHLFYEYLQSVTDKMRFTDKVNYAVVRLEQLELWSH